jgi:hypothetical protein
VAFAGKLASEFPGFERATVGLPVLLKVVGCENETVHRIARVVPCDHPLRGICA